jgi:hypothetical protein
VPFIAKRQPDALRSSFLTRMMAWAIRGHVSFCLSAEFLTARIPAPVKEKPGDEFRRVFLLDLSALYFSH